MLRRPRTAAAAGLLLLPLLTGPLACRAAPATSFVLRRSGPGSRTSHLPAGTTVVTRMPHVGARAGRPPRAGALGRLARVPGVRGASHDVALQTMSNGSGASGGVLAPEAVGGIAGGKAHGRGVVVAVVDSGVEESAPSATPTSG